MRKTDINRYNTTTTEFKTGEESKRVANDITSSAFATVWQLFKTFFCVLLVAGIIVLSTVIAYIVSLSNQASLELSKTSISLKYTSFVYAVDEDGVDKEYMSFYNIENRIWVDYVDMPKAMTDAVIAIEDKRFYEHHGVDWKGTAAGALGLITGVYRGGSTITQQVIKNITQENQVSLNRKIKEIFSALALEKKYSKQEILESYLNIVNFGNGCMGVQAAANDYFGIDIGQCSIAQCAAIAGITQNPSYYNPLIYPEHNKERRETILSEMHTQGKITDAEYDAAMAESANMVFSYSDDSDTEEDDKSGIWDWYTDAMFEKLVADLMDSLGCSSEMAEMMIYQGGITIHSAMDMRAQKIAQEVYLSEDYRPSDEDILSGFYMIGYDGRVLATVGSLDEKTGNRVWSNAVDAGRQAGSAIKPISIYSLALENGLINYSSLVSNQPLDNYFGPGRPGPNNWNGIFSDGVTTEYALEISLNAPAAQLSKQLSPFTSYTFLTDKLNFKHLTEADSEQISSMALGGVNGGITVEELTSAFQIIGNGGVFNKPYYYYYVEDHDGNVILDNREKTGEKVISSETSTVLLKLLKNVIYGAEGTGYGASIPGWEMFAKTGTTDSNKDAWFIGATPACVAGVWTGYDIPATLSSTQYAKSLWKGILTQYLEPLNPDDYSYVLDADIISATYCKETGLLAGSGCKETATGWYEKGHLPSTCKDDHESSSELSSELSSEISSTASSEVSSSLPPSSSEHSSSSASSSSSVPPSSTIVPSNSEGELSSSSSSPEEGNPSSTEPHEPE